MSPLPYLRSAYLLLLIGWSAFLLSCQKDDSNLQIDDEPRIDEELQPLLDRFLLDAQSFGLDYTRDVAEMTIRFGALESNLAGLCEFSGGRFNEITIDRAWWRRANSLQKEWVMYHELGHCVLGRGHLNDLTARGTCVSIMHSGVGINCTAWYNSATRPRYLEELFSR